MYVSIRAFYEDNCFICSIALNPFLHLDYFFQEQLNFKEVNNKQGYCGSRNDFLLFYCLGLTQWCKMLLGKRMVKFE